MNETMATGSPMMGSMKGSMTHKTMNAMPHSMGHMMATGSPEMMGEMHSTGTMEAMPAMDSMHNMGSMDSMDKMHMTGSMGSMDSMHSMGSMGSMGSMSMGGPDITVFGLPFVAFLMIASGVFYLICSFFLWKPLREEKNELIGALYAFLVYQAFSMTFMGIEQYTMNMLWGNLASLSIIIGSVYMLKFPFSSFSQTTRRISFISSLVVLLLGYIWFMVSPERQMLLESYIIWYDIAVNGLLVGIFMLSIGFRSTEDWLRIKALGGGSGVTSCCVVSNVAMLSGALFVSSLFQFLAPVVILGSIGLGRSLQKKAQQKAQKNA